MSSPAASSPPAEASVTSSNDHINFDGKGTLILICVDGKSVTVKPANILGFSSPLRETCMMKANRLSPDSDVPPFPAEGEMEEMVVEELLIRADALEEVIRFLLHYAKSHRAPHPSTTTYRFHDSDEENAASDFTRKNKKPGLFGELRWADIKQGWNKGFLDGLTSPDKEKDLILRVLQAADQLQIEPLKQLIAQYIGESMQMLSNEKIRERWDIPNDLYDTNRPGTPYHGAALYHEAQWHYDDLLKTRAEADGCVTGMKNGAGPGGKKQTKGNNGKGNGKGKGKGKNKKKKKKGGN